MTAFEIVKDSVNIVDAAERYGIEVNQHKKALCPFHNDRNPSLSFKGERFTCFSCGASGDVIDLVGRLNNLPPLDTVRELNQAYNLHIDIDKPVPSREVQRRKQRQEKKKAFAEWETRAHNTLAGYFRRLREWRVKYAPRYPGAALHPLFVEALTRQDYIEYILNAVFIEGDMTEKAAFYKEYREMVGQIARRMEKERTVNVRGIGTGDNPSGIVFPFEFAAAGYAEKAA